MDSTGFHLPSERSRVNVVTWAATMFLFFHLSGKWPRRQRDRVVSRWINVRVLSAAFIIISARAAAERKRQGETLTRYTSGGREIDSEFGAKALTT